MTSLRHLPRTVLTRRREAPDSTRRPGGRQPGATGVGDRVERRQLQVRPIASLRLGGYAGLDARIGGSPADGSGPDLQPVVRPDAEASAVADGAWLVAGAGAVLGRWSAGGDQGPSFVAVPVDHRFLAADGFLGAVKDGVRTAGIRPADLLLTLEAGPALDEVWSKVQRLRSHGVRIALDGFTVASDAPDLVRRFPFDVVRMTVPAGVRSDDDVAADHRASIKLAHNAGCDVIVDQVGDDDQLDLARRLGADLAVGPRLGGPLPLADGVPVLPRPAWAGRTAG